MNHFLLALTLFDPTFHTKLEGFILSTNKFTLEYQGCPPDTLVPSGEVCDYRKGHFNLTAWEESRRRAKDLFGLVEKEKGRKK